jgi:hypothetical protein
MYEDKLASPALLPKGIPITECVRWEEEEEEEKEVELRWFERE